MVNITSERYKNQIASVYFLLLAESELNWTSDCFFRTSNGYTLKPANLNQRYIL